MVPLHYRGKEATTLILTRRPGESIIIELPTGEQIKLAVLGVKGNQVRVGTEAPADMVILREELVSSDASCCTRPP